MSANPVDLTDLASVKSWLGVTTTDNDVRLQSLITAGSLFLLNQLNRPSLVPTDYDEWYNAGVQNFLLLRQWPVISVASVQADGWVVTQPATGNPPCNGWQIDPGENGDGQCLLIVHGKRFCGGRRSVRVQYRAGYVTIPGDLAQACVELVGERWKMRDRIGVRSKTLPNGESVTFVQSDMTPSIASAIDNFMRVAPS